MLGVFGHAAPGYGTAVRVEKLFTLLSNGTISELEATLGAMSDAEVVGAVPMLENYTWGFVVCQRALIIALPDTLLREAPPSSPRIVPSVRTVLEAMFLGTAPESTVDGPPPLPALPRPAVHLDSLRMVLDRGIIAPSDVMYGAILVGDALLLEELVSKGAEITPRAFFVVGYALVPANDDPFDLAALQCYNVLRDEVNRRMGPDAAVDWIERAVTAGRKRKRVFMVRSSSPFPRWEVRVLVDGQEAAEDDAVEEIPRCPFPPPTSFARYAFEMVLLLPEPAAAEEALWELSSTARTGR